MSAPAGVLPASGARAHQSDLMLEWIYSLLSDGKGAGGMLGRIWQAMPGKNPLVKFISLLVSAILAVMAFNWAKHNPGPIGDRIYSFFSKDLAAFFRWLDSLLIHASKSK